MKTIEEQLAELKAENAALKAAKAKAQTISMKVSEKGAVSLYGLGRFPVTLYSQQWERLLEKGTDIRTFIETNRAQLKTKEEATKA